MCNDDGQCISEGLRDLIKMGLDAYEEGLEIEKEQPKPVITYLEEKPSVISHGKILDDDGNVIGTF